MPTPSDQARPSLRELIDEIGAVGAHMAEIGASEGAAGNISLYIDWPIDLGELFPLEEQIALPLAVPELAGGSFVVSGSGQRLRQIRFDPPASLGCLSVEPGGTSARLFSSTRRRFQRLTSEFNSHLAVHYDQAVRTGAAFHAVLHAQPVHLTYLSHLDEYADSDTLTRHLMRWQPETIFHMPEGIAVLPFMLPGSKELMAATAKAMGERRVVVWARHGVIVRSAESVTYAADYIDYLEAAARYEYLDLSLGGRAPGLSAAQLRAIAGAYGLQQNLF